MKKVDKKLEQKLKLIKQTKSRFIMPRSSIFEDKSKFKRSRQKILDRKIISNY